MYRLHLRYCNLGGDVELLSYLMLFLYILFVFRYVHILQHTYYTKKDVIVHVDLNNQSDYAYNTMPHPGLWLQDW